MRRDITEQVKAVELEVMRSGLNLRAFIGSAKLSLLYRQHNHLFMQGYLSLLQRALKNSSSREGYSGDAGIAQGIMLAASGSCSTPVITAVMQEATRVAIGRDLDDRTLLPVALLCYLDEKVRNHPILTREDEAIEQIIGLINWLCCNSQTRTNWLKHPSTPQIESRFNCSRNMLSHNEAYGYGLLTLSRYGEDKTFLDKIVVHTQLVYKDGSKYLPNVSRILGILERYREECSSSQGSKLQQARNIIQTADKCDIKENILGFFMLTTEDQENHIIALLDFLSGLPPEEQNKIVLRIIKNEQLFNEENSEKATKCGLLACKPVVDVLVRELDPTGKRSSMSIIEAAKNNHIAIVIAKIAALLAPLKGCTGTLSDLLKTKDKLGKTALHYAAERGHADVVGALIKAGANASQKDNDGLTALDHAARNGCAGVVRVLLAAGVDVSIEDECCRFNTLHYAAELGHESVVKLLLAAGADVNARGEGCTALHYAAIRGHAGVVKALLDAGADVNATDDCGETALHNAAKKDNQAIVTALISAGANVNATNKEGNTALQLATDRYSAANVDLYVVRALLNAGANVECDSLGFLSSVTGELADLQGEIQASRNLISAAQSDNVGDVQAALDKRAIVNATDNDGRTALQLAALNGREGVVKALLAAGADVNKTDKDSRTALHYAARHDDASVVQALIAAGADVSAQDKCESTPLHLAAENGHEEVVRALIERGADVTATDKKGKTALQLAAANGHVDVVRALLNAGANVECDSLNSPEQHYDDKLAGLRTQIKASRDLIDAVKTGNIDAVTEALENRAIVNARDKYGEKALDLAAENGHAEVVRALIAAGANANATNEDGETALHYAACSGKVETVRALLAAGADVNARGDGYTALTLAVNLMQSGADGDPGDNAKHEAVIEALLNAGANVCCTSIPCAGMSEDLQTKIQASRDLIDAVKNNQTADGDTLLASVQEYLFQGAIVNATNEDGKTALQLAAANGHVDVVTALLNAGANIFCDLIPCDDMSEDLQTKIQASLDLIRAAQRGNVDEVNKAISNGAIVNAKDSGSQTALHLAAANGHAHVVDALIAVGADVTAKDNYGETALSYAKTNDHQDIGKAIKDCAFKQLCRDISAQLQSSQSDADDEFKSEEADDANANANKIDAAIQLCATALDSEFATTHRKNGSFLCHYRKLIGRRSDTSFMLTVKKIEGILQKNRSYAPGCIALLNAVKYHGVSFQQATSGAPAREVAGAAVSAAAPTYTGMFGVSGADAAAAPAAATDAGACAATAPLTRA